MKVGSNKIGELLVQQQVVSQSQLARAVAYHEEKGVLLGQAAVELGLCSETQVARALADQQGMPFAELDPPPPRQVMKLIPPEVARSLRVVPVRIEGNRLFVATLDPFDIRLDTALTRQVGMPVVMCFAAEGQLSHVLEHYEQIQQGTSLSSRVPGAALSPVFGSAAADAAPAQAAEILEQALRRRATEVRLEPDSSGVKVRGRIDGHISPLATMTLAHGKGVIHGLKRVCNMVAEQSKRPQETSGQVDVGGVVANFAARTLIGQHGETLFISLSLDEARLRPLSDLGCDAAVIEEINLALQTRSGLLLVAGPGGAGVTSALYSLHSHLIPDELVTVSLEKSVTSVLEGVAQLVPTRAAGMTLPELLVALRAQRPDLVLVDDLWGRDAATPLLELVDAGSLAMVGLKAPSVQAALDQYLDPLDDPRFAANRLIGVLSTRIVRTICDQCGDEYLPTDEAAEVLTSCLGDLDGTRFRKGLGCDGCFYTGFRGRTGLHEMLTMDDDLRYLIGRRVLPSLLDRNLRKRNPRTLLDDAAWKAAAGIISPEEVLRLGRKSPERDPFESLGVGLRSLQALF